MRKVFCWALLSLAVFGTVAVSAYEEERDVRPPIVAVSPCEATVNPYTEFMLTISYRYTRSITINASHTGRDFWILEAEDSYKSDVRSFNYFSQINTPLVSVVFEVIATNNEYVEMDYSYISTNNRVL